MGDKLNMAFVKGGGGGLQTVEQEDVSSILDEKELLSTQTGLSILRRRRLACLDILFTGAKYRVRGKENCAKSAFPLACNTLSATRRSDIQWLVS